MHKGEVGELAGLEQLLDGFDHWNLAFGHELARSWVLNSAGSLHFSHVWRGSLRQGRCPDRAKSMLVFQ